MPALCYNSAMKISCMNVLLCTHALIYLNTQNNGFVLNALLECITFLLHIVFLTYLKHLSI